MDKFVFQIPWDSMASVGYTSELIGYVKYNNYIIPLLKYISCTKCFDDKDYDFDAYIGQNGDIDCTLSVTGAIGIGYKMLDNIDQSYIEAILYHEICHILFPKFATEIMGDLFAVAHVGSNWYVNAMRYCDNFIEDQGKDKSYMNGRYEYISQYSEWMDDNIEVCYDREEAIRILKDNKQERFKFECRSIFRKDSNCPFERDLATVIGYVKYSYYDIPLVILNKIPRDTDNIHMDATDVWRIGAVTDPITFNKCIVIGKYFWEQMKPEHIEAFLYHEIAHIIDNGFMLESFADRFAVAHVGPEQFTEAVIKYEFCVNTFINCNPGYIVNFGCKPTKRRLQDIKMYHKVIDTKLEIVLKEERK